MVISKVTFLPNIVTLSYPIGTLGAFNLINLGCEQSRLHFYQVPASRFKRGETATLLRETRPRVDV